MPSSQADPEAWRYHAASSIRIVIRFLPIDCGNVRESDPLAVYREHPVFRALRDADRLTGKCRACAYRRICGGSRARAFALSGNFLDSDPLCAYRPPGYVEEPNQSARRLEVVE